jgi:pimeloyl-ACP methyl ester carboxylesterase
VTPEPIDVRTHGSRGPTVVLLHGGPGAPGSVADLAGDLAAGFRVLEPLQRRAGSQPLTVAQHVADLAAVAPDRAVFVGHSWGAMLALSFAARHPGRVKSLTLIGCGTYDLDARRAFQRTVDDRITPDDRTRLDELELRLESATDPAGHDRLLDELGQIFGDAESFAPLPPDRSSEPLPADGPGFTETWADVLRLQETGVEPASFSSIRCPVLMLHGDHDPHPGPAIRDTLRRHIPHLEYTDFPRCGHTPWRERHARELFLQRLREWLAA